MHYRPEVDGLRAIAVIPVIFFHAGMPLFSGGFVGVDVFFVISGYLITTIIYQEMVQDRFSIMRFYERRARRILPALLFVSAACIPFAWLWMLPSELRDFSQSLVGVATFTSNILFWRESGYFAAPAELKPLLHTWSLAVEEQFYILYPPILMALYRFGTSRLVLAISLGLLISLGVAQWASTEYPGANFYLLPSRAWELGVGALVALYLHRQPPAVPRVLRELAGVAGLVLIAYAVVIFDDTTPFPSFWALIPVIGTALVILAADSGTLAGRLLGLPVFVGVGLISYSLYLWHQPLFAFARIYFIDDVPVTTYWQLIALAFVLAYLTWLTVELPVRKRLKLPRLQILSGAVVGCLTVGIVGAIGWAMDGLTSRNAVAFEMKGLNGKSPFREKCNNPKSPEAACILGNDQHEPVYVWADSHGIELAWQLSEVLHPDGIPVVQMTHGACQPTVGVSRLTGKVCHEYNREIFEYLTEAVPPSTVLLIARWSLNTNGERFDNKEGGVESGGEAAVYPLNWESGSDAERVEQIGKAISLTISGLLEAGHRVVLVYPVPEVGWRVPDYVARKGFLGQSLSDPLSTDYQVYLERSANARGLLDAVPDHQNLLRIRPAELLCDTFLPGRCVAQLEDGTPLYFDDDHPNGSGARLISEEILRGFHSKGWLASPPNGRQAQGAASASRN
jgi:peptidoglycan/LPS O-acetylase OafA/YrhL